MPSPPPGSRQTPGISHSSGYESFGQHLNSSAVGPVSGRGSPEYPGSYSSWPAVPGTICRCSHVVPGHQLSFMTPCHLSRIPRFNSRSIMVLLTLLLHFHPVTGPPAAPKTLLQHPLPQKPQFSQIADLDQNDHIYSTILLSYESPSGTDLCPGYRK
jgi:hypothetical protein